MRPDLVIYRGPSTAPDFEYLPGKASERKAGTVGSTERCANPMIPCETRGSCDRHRSIRSRTYGSVPSRHRVSCVTTPSGAYTNSLSELPVPKHGVGRVVSGLPVPRLTISRSKQPRTRSVAIVAKLDQFRGESRFSTWVYKFAIFEVSTKFRRHFWTKPTTPMDPEEWERLPDRFGVEPDQLAERRELIDAMHIAVETALTARQRQIFVAIVLRGVPLDVLVEQLGSNRNAIYKTLFDARRKLRVALAANGHLDDDEVRSR